MSTGAPTLPPTSQVDKSVQNTDSSVQKFLEFALAGTRVYGKGQGREADTTSIISTSISRTLSGLSAQTLSRLSASGVIDPNSNDAEPERFPSLTTLSTLGLVAKHDKALPYFLGTFGRRLAEQIRIGHKV